MAGRVPENTLLSHDLFEGIFARAGLVTDIELFDEFPSNYLVVRRPASTAGPAATGSSCRGSWPGPRCARGRRSRSSMPALARWKMVDNLRRTLSAPLALATLVAAWTLPSVSAAPVDRVRRWLR